MVELHYSILVNWVVFFSVENVGIPRVDVYILCTQNESGSMFELCTLLSNIQRGCCVEFCSRNVCTLEAIVRYDNNGN